MKVKYSKSALKFLAGVQKKVADSIREAISGLTLAPPEGDIKTMQGYNDGRLRLRVGKYRVIYPGQQHLLFRKNLLIKIKP